MDNQRNTVSIWEDSMRIGLQKLDDERRELTNILEHLDVTPLNTISSEIFLIKFGIFEAAAKAFFSHEEALFNEYQVPDSVRKAHEEEHTRVLAMLNTVYVDSMSKRNQTAIDVYRMIRNEMQGHILKFGQELRKYICTQKIDCIQ